MRIVDHNRIRVIPKGLTMSMMVMTTVRGSPSPEISSKTITRTVKIIVDQTLIAII